MEEMEITNNKCKICSDQIARYVCPKCNISYCSVNCYKSEIHLQCSENFYRDCIMSEMVSQSPGKSKKDMYDILSRIHNKETQDDGDDIEDVVDSDDEEHDDLADRIAGIDLNNVDELWSKLTNDEKQEFESIIHSGKATELIPQWKPWWEYHNNKLVEDIEETKSDYTKNCPKMYKIVDIKTLMKNEPADCVKYNIVNVLSAYVYIARYFNGDHHDFHNEAINVLVSLCSNLLSNNNFYDVETAIVAVKMDAINYEFLNLDHEQEKLIKEDIKHLLQGPNDSDNTFYILAALSDIKKLLTMKSNDTDASSIEFKKMFVDSTKYSMTVVKKSNIKLYTKKIEFYLSYVKSYGLKVF